MSRLAPIDPAAAAPRRRAAALARVAAILSLGAACRGAPSGGDLAVEAERLITDECPAIGAGDGGRGARPGLGEACEGRPCAGGLRCANGTFTCIEIGGAGSPCVDDHACGADFFCDPGSGRCDADREPGAACEDDVECRAGTCDGGRCVAWPGAGEPCRDHECGEGAACQWFLDRCVADGGAGEGR